MSLGVGRPEKDAGPDLRGGKAHPSVQCCDSKGGDSGKVGSPISGVRGALEKKRKLSGPDGQKGTKNKNYKKKHGAKKSERWSKGGKEKKRQREGEKGKDNLVLSDCA